jgi:hypothetical protein
MKKLTKKSKLAQKLANDNAKGAQIGIIEELFYDLYPNRWEIYKVNFFRGIAFGFGSFIGATVIILATIWFLNLFVNIPGGVGDFVQAVINTMNSRTK